MRIGPSGQKFLIDLSIRIITDYGAGRTRRAWEETLARNRCARIDPETADGLALNTGSRFRSLVSDASSCPSRSSRLILAL